MAGLSILKRLLMKQAMKESAPFQNKGIMSISKSLSGNVDAKVKKWAESAKRQGQDLDKMSEQELKYLIELNKPRAPTVLSNEEAYKFLNQFLNQGKKGEVIRGKFKPVVTVDSVITDIKKLEPIESMKEANRVLRGEGKYKNLSKADREKIVGDESVTDHIFERNIEPDPEDFAQGGRIGYFGGAIVDPEGHNITRREMGILANADPSMREMIRGFLTSRKKHKFVYPDRILDINRGKRTGDFAQGGPAGLSYLLAEDINERMPLAGGGSGKPPINFYFDMQGGAGKEAQNIYGVKGLNEKGYNYGGTFAADTTFPLLGGELSVGGELGFGRDKSDVDYKGRPIDFLSNVNETKLGDNWNVGMKWRKKFSGGGMGRRAFLKLMAALGATGIAAKSGLAGLLKGGKKQVAKELTQVPIKNIKGMPAWFKPLVNKVIKEGDDVTKKWATQERQIVHKTKLPDSQTDVLVTQDLNTGDVVVDIGLEKHGFQSGKYGQPVRLEYKASEVIEGPIKKGKPTKTKEEFNVEEAEFTGGHPENVKFEESTIEKFGDHASNFDEVEMFATGKVKKSKPTKKAQQLEWEQGKAEADADRWADEN